MKITIACDSMKGCLTSEQVSQAVCKGIRDVCPGADVVRIGVADGGEGTASILTRALGGKMYSVVVCGPLRQNVTATYGIINDTAIIDIASAAGLTLIDSKERNPLITTTFGVGELMVDAWGRGCRRYIIGLGGSATNDAGKGMLEALGVKFLDSNGERLSDGGASLTYLSKIEMSDARTDILRSDITVMCDVTNPLCGVQGASRVYGPQKGATPEMAAILDNALQRFAGVVETHTGRKVANMHGAGAAGGLGAAFLAFTNARLQSGIDTVLDLQDFNCLATGSDLVITGEGCIDNQTLSGKAPHGILKRCQALNIPVAAIAGCVRDREILCDAGFADVRCINPTDISLETAMNPDIAMANIRQTVTGMLKISKNCEK